MLEFSLFLSFSFIFAQFFPEIILCLINDSFESTEISNFIFFCHFSLKVHLIKRKFKWNKQSV